MRSTNVRFLSPYLWSVVSGGLEVEGGDLVAQLRGELVVLLRHRFAQTALEVQPLPLLVLPGRVAGGFAGAVDARGVHILQQRLKPLAERLVIVRAPQTPMLAELRPAQSAMVADDLRVLGLLRGLRGIDLRAARQRGWVGEKLLEREGLGDVDALLRGAFLSHVQLFFHVILDVGQMNRGRRFFADLTDLVHVPSLLFLLAARATTRARQGQYESGGRFFAPSRLLYSRKPSARKQPRPEYPHNLRTRAPTRQQNANAFASIFEQKPAKTATMVAVDNFRPINYILLPIKKIHAGTVFCQLSLAYPDVFRRNVRRSKSTISYCNRTNCRI